MLEAYCSFRFFLSSTFIVASACLIFLRFCAKLYRVCKMISAVMLLLSMKFMSFSCFFFVIISIQRMCFFY